MFSYLSPHDSKGKRVEKVVLEVANQFSDFKRERDAYTDAKRSGVKGDDLAKLKSAADAAYTVYASAVRKGGGTPLPKGY